MKDDVAKSMSIRARINNFAKAKGISPQHALQAFFAERFLARIERSRYAKNLAVKGGTLMSSILGVAQRTTMDVDATVIGLRVDEEAVKGIVAEVAKDRLSRRRFRGDDPPMGKLSGLCALCERHWIRLDGPGGASVFHAP